MTAILIPRFNRTTALRIACKFMIICLFGVLSSSHTLAQLDTLHYIPPFGTDNSTNEIPGNVHIYLSTPEVLPVNYTITDLSGTTVLQSGVVVSGTPVRYDSFGIASGVAIDDADLNTVLTAGTGFRVTSDMPIYANLRVRSSDNAQAGSLTSKGTNAFGTTFRLGSIPNQQNNSNKATSFSFAATEDNTTVNIDMTGSGVVLEGTSPPNTASVISVTLNEGDCYVMRCEANVDANNLDGMIGTLLTSDQPIVVNTGSWNGEPTNSDGRDYGIDQIVGLQKIGSDYVFIRASGGDDQELPMIVAHYDNTEIYVNGNPIAVATINAGQYHTVNGSSYVNEVMHIHTSQDAFAYQILAGNNAGNTAGMNFVPDISCQVESNIDAVVDVEQIGPDNFTGGITITTEAGSNIYINGVLETSTPVTITIWGGNQYDVYKLLGMTGDQHITSDTYAIVSFFGVSGVAGYAGYFSGFSRPQSVLIQPDPMFSNAVETCGAALFTMERSGDTTEVLTCNVNLGGTAINLIDYDIFDITLTPMGSTVTFAANETIKYYIIMAISDDLAEGTETIDITVDWQICEEVNTFSQSFTVEDAYINITCQNDTIIYADPTTCGTNFTFGYPTVDSNCSTGLTRLDGTGISSGDFLPIGSYTISWQGNISGGVQTDQCSFNILVEDNLGPDMTCGSNVNVTADTGTCFATGVTLTPPTMTDNCGVSGATNDAPATFPIGTTVVTWTVVDDSGNTATCTQDVTVIDAENPTITCPSDVTVSADAGLCTASGVALGSATTNDNCSVASVTNDAPATFPLGTTTVTWTVVDGSGNTTTCTQDVTVNDAENPTITCPADIAQTADASVCEALVTVPAPATADNCSVASVANDYNGSSDASDIYPVGTTTVVWTVTDLAGNTTTCSMDIVVTDDENPSITCPADMTQGTDFGLCEAFVTIPTPDTADNCGVDTVVNDYTGTDDASGIYETGITTVTWTITDIHGNITECTMTITINDTENPAVACPEDQIELLDDNCEFSIPDYTSLASATDNCDTNIDLTQSPAAGTVISGSGTTQIITITATDDAGNATDCTYVITLDDIIAPTIVCQEDLEMNVDDNCELAIPDFTGNVIANDNCNTFTLTQDPAPGTLVTLGDYTVTITAEDPDENATSCDFTLSVTDMIPPVITCPEDQTVDLNDNCEHVLGDYTAMVIATDNCSDMTIIQDPVEGTTITASTTMSIIVTDEYGNASACLFEVILEDNIDPVIACPEDISWGSDTGLCGAIVEYELPIVSDNCQIASLDLIAGFASGEFFEVGATTITYVVIDGFGNTAECSFTVTVEDTELPVIVCPENIDINNDAGICGAVVEYELPIVLDNCAVDSLNMYEGLASGEIFPIGLTTVGYVVIDIHGNSDTCSFDVVITDNEPPVISLCTEDIIQTIDEGECGAIVTFDIPTVTDNCGIEDVEVTSGFESGELFPVGTTTVTWTITDENGNMSICSFDITVEDDEAPILECPENLIVENDPGFCGALVAFDSPEWSDNCGTATYELVEGIASGEYFPVGITTQVFEITDEVGNVSTCSFEITVLDTEAPIIKCPEDIVQIDPTVIYELPFFTDNCAAEIALVEGLASGEDFPHGYTTVTYMATDLAGNSTLCSFEVLINTPPVGEDDTVDFLEEDDEIEIDVLDNDWDPDGDDIFLCGEAWAEVGQVEIENGLLIYAPFEGWCGTDTITYVLCDEFNASDTAQVVVQVECFIDLIIPEGMSPNGDGVNDVFEIIGLEDYPGNTLTIYNRWGYKIFEAENYKNDWDGKACQGVRLGNGLLPTGTYFFVLQLGDATIKPVKGFIYLNH